MTHDEEVEFVQKVRAAEMQRLTAFCELMPHRAPMWMSTMVVQPGKFMTPAEVYESGTGPCQQAISQARFKVLNKAILANAVASIFGQMPATV